VLKASTGKWFNCLFPYDRKGKLLSPEIALSAPSVREHFSLHKQDLLKGKKEYPSYYEYGRTQAIQDVWKDKIAINALIRTENDLKVEIVKEGQGVYSGLYIINNDVIIPFEDIIGILTTKDFAKYVSLLKKYKSGGYYTYNSKDVEQYINYMLTYKSNKNYDDQPRLSEHNLRLF
jgi:adenine-specific DNA-methyltransferase